MFKTGTKFEYRISSIGYRKARVKPGGRRIAKTSPSPWFDMIETNKLAWGGEYVAPLQGAAF